MYPSQSRFRSTRTLLPIAAALALSLSACGGGGGGTASVNPAANTTLKGAVIDAPIANATVTFTTNAPMGQPGAVVVGTATADASGNYTVQVALPNTSAPLFANATSPDGQVVLTAYLGPSSAVLAAGALTPANLPNLVISQVTTAALAVYVAAGGSYANLTPALYAALLSQHHDDILALSAAIKAVADGYCVRPSGYKDTDDLARGLAKNGMGNSTPGTLGTASAALGPSCDGQLKALMQYIASDDRWAPELDIGDMIEQGTPAVAVGTYSLQGVLAQSGMRALPTPPAPPASTASVPTSTGTLPPGILNTLVTVDANGDVSSTDSNVTGVIVGNLMTLTVKDGQGTTYTLAGKVGLLPSGLVTTRTAPSPTPSAAASSPTSSSAVGYALRMGGRTQAGGVLTRFDAVLVPQNSLPGWTQLGALAKSHDDGVNCGSNSGQFGVRLMGTGASVGGYVLGACVMPQTTGLTLSQASYNGQKYGDDDFKPGASVSFTQFTLNNLSSTPYILNAPTVTITRSNSSGQTSSVSGQMFYVMGAKDMIFSTSAQTSGTASNALFVMNENPLDTLQQGKDQQDR
ncbi:MAG: hypothetical protein ACP5F9_04980 [Thiomonas sp.]